MSSRAEPSVEPIVHLTYQECNAIHGLISELTGGNPENVFDWEPGGVNDINDPYVSALVKIYRAAGRDVPKGCPLS